jgi:hypothetical protein
MLGAAFVRETISKTSLSIRNMMQVLSRMSWRAVHGPFPRSGIRPAVYGGLPNRQDHELQAPFMGLLAGEA